MELTLSPRLTITLTLRSGLIAAPGGGSWASTRPISTCSSFFRAASSRTSPFFSSRADASSDVGLVGYEMAVLVERCGAVLTPELRAGLERLRILDSSQFLAELLPALPFRRRVARVVLHPVCSAQKLGLQPTLEAVARACADELLVPSGAGCCGFAGDRGLLVPELTASALRAEACELAALPADTACVSTSRGCEIGLTRATGRPFRSLAQLLEEATRPPAPR